MPRSTASGVFVEEIAVHTPPYDKPGVIQEYVGDSLYHEYEVLESADNLTSDNVSKILDSARDTIGLRSGEYQIEYSLAVRAPTARAARLKARLFARLKNPTEFSRIAVSEPEKYEKNRIMDGYEVTVTVEK